MALSLVVGPAHAGKVALLLERYLGVLDRDPWLIVPNRGDVERVERDLLRRRPALLAGRIGTFDDVFEQIAFGDPERRPVASGTQRTLAVRRAIATTALDTIRDSSASAGFADVLLDALGELESALVDPDAVGGDLGHLARAYRAELRSLGLWDRDGLRRRAAERIGSDLDAWDRTPVFAYGFEDLTAAEWALIEALAARTDVTVSIPYEPGRVAFAALENTVSDLARLAAEAVTDLPPAERRPVPAALVHLERGLFGDGPPLELPLEGAVEFLEGAGARGTVELVAAELLELSRNGTPLERIGVVCESPDRWRATFESVLGRTGDSVCLRASFAVGRDGTRSRVRRASPLRLAGRRTRRALLVPSLSVLRSRASLGGLRRRTPAGTRSRGSCPRRGGDREAPRSAHPCPCRAACGARPDPRRRARCSRRWCETRGVSRRPLSETTHAAMRGPIARPYARSPSWRSSRSSTNAVSGTRISSLRSSGPSCGRVPLPRPAESPFSTTAARGRGPSTSCSCSGSRKGAFLVATGRLRSWTTTCGAISEAASNGRTPSRATAISSIRRVRGRLSGSFSFAKPPATKAFRVSRARSGRTSGRSLLRPTSRASRAAGRCPA